MATNYEEIDWQEEAKRRNVSDVYVQSVDLGDPKQSKLLYTEFGIVEDVEAQIFLRDFVRRAQQDSAKRSRDATNLSSPARLTKKLKCDGAAEMVEIKTGVSVKLCTRSITELNDKRLESLQYFGREGTQIVFEELVLSKEELKKKHKGKYNISLIGNLGAGKSTLVWAVAHKIVNVHKEQVLWMSRRDSQRAWTVHLFQWDDTDQKAYVYKIENAPEDVKELLDNTELTGGVSVLILDSPTKSKTDTSRPGVKAFEWALDENNQKRVIHVSSLGAFSLDGRILNEFYLVNRTLFPWKRNSYIRSVETSESLKDQLINTLIEDAKNDSERTEMKGRLNGLPAAELVDMKFFFAGINARWFFNYSIKEIKEECINAVKRMPSPGNTCGEASEFAVNSVSVEVLLPDSKTIKLYTSAFMICTLSDKSVTDKFLSLFPLVADRLGNGSPGEVFEFDFCAYIEHCHNLLKVEERIMGEGKCEEIQIELGTDIMTGKKVRWRAGTLLSLPKGKNHDVAAQPMPDDLDPEKKNHYWFIPEDNSQPFLDFFVLQPSEENDEWELLVLQNTVSKRHGTDLAGLISVIKGIHEKGFLLDPIVQMVFVINDRQTQAEVGNNIEKKFEVPLTSSYRALRSSGSATKEFTLNVSRVQYQSRGIAPETF